jgi:hypothetical protein
VHTSSTLRGCGVPGFTHVVRRVKILFGLLLLFLLVSIPPSGTWMVYRRHEDGRY